MNEQTNEHTNGNYILLGINAGGITSLNGVKNNTELFLFLCLTFFVALS